MPTDRRHRLPANVAATFEETPSAGMVIEKMGHAYGTARYAGRCPLTGASISIGAAIRHVVIWTRDGSRFEGHILNHGIGKQGMAALQFTGAGLGFSTWHRGTVDELIAALDDEDCTSLEWMTDDGEVRSVSRGWKAGTWGRNQSPKQVAARLRRTKGVRFVRARRDGWWGKP